MAKDMLNKFERLGELKTMNRKTPKTTDGLMRHIRDNKGIQINGSTEKTSYETSAIFMDSRV